MFPESNSTIFDNKWTEFMLKRQSNNCFPCSRKEELENSAVMTKQIAQIKTNIKCKVACENSGRQSMRKEASLLTRKDINFAVSCDVIATQGTAEEE